MKTHTFTIDASPPGEAVTAQTSCGRIVLGENGQAGTAAWTIAGPTSGDDPVTIPAGAKHEFTHPQAHGRWAPGDVVAYAAAATGALTMAQEEY